MGNVMPRHISTLHQLREAPQWILLPTGHNSTLFVAALAAAAVLCIISFSFISCIIII